MLKPWPWVASKSPKVITKEGLPMKAAEEGRSNLGQENVTGHGGSQTDQVMSILINLKNKKPRVRH